VISSKRSTAGQTHRKSVKEYLVLIFTVCLFATSDGLLFFKSMFTLTHPFSEGKLALNCFLAKIDEPGNRLPFHHEAPGTRKSFRSAFPGELEKWLLQWPVIGQPDRR
jgi:hypothetical protein